MHEFGALPVTPEGKTVFNTPLRGKSAGGFA
jgi:hypothetical protein